MVEFKEKTVLITGAGSGIGEAIAYQFAKRGTNVILTGLGAESLQNVKVNCEALGVKAYPFEMDLSDTKSIDSMVDYVNSEGLKPNFFVLNAGISQRALTLESDFSIDKKIMDINYFGGVYLIKKFRTLLLSAEVTHISVNTSISGLFGFPMRSAYCASKHALIGFYEALRLEYPNIKVTFLIPGRVNTNISMSAVTASGSAYGKMDPGQANGISVEKCAKVTLRAIEKEKKQKLIGGKELLMVYFYKFTPWLFYKLAKKISAT